MLCLNENENYNLFYNKKNYFVVLRLTKKRILPKFNFACDIYPSETSCKQDLEILGSVSKILSRSVKDNSFL